MPTKLPKLFLFQFPASLRAGLEALVDKVNVLVATSLPMFTLPPTVIPWAVDCMFNEPALPVTPSVKLLTIPKSVVGVPMFKVVPF